MVDCPNCNKTYDENFKFCPYCGEKKPEGKICPNCEMEPNVEFSFCPECGTELVSKSQWEELKRDELNKLNEEIIEYEELGEYKKALECFDKLIELEPENIPYWKEKREELKRKGAEILRKEAKTLKEAKRYKLRKYEEALECIEKAIKLEPENPENWRVKADCFIRLKKHQKALRCIEKAIKLEPENPENWIKKGIIFNLLGRYEKRKECYEKAISLGY